MKFHIYRFKAYVLFIAMCLTVSSCELFDLDINKDPNNPTEASLELLLANAQLEGVRTFSGTLNDGTMGFVGLVSANDDHNLTFSTWNGHWNNLYSGALADLDKIIVAAEAAGNNPHYLGVAQVMKAYYFSLMVDLWGRVPYFDAFKGETGNKAPNFDEEKAIYDDLILLCDKAVANFALTSPVPVRGDLIYNGGIAKWRKAAKSMKLRLYLNARAAYPEAQAQIQTLIDGDDLIMVPADDFTFKFSPLQNPDDRHPMYQAGYSGGEAAYSYYGHQFMAEMLAARDPRTPYYFKRQTSTVLDPGDPTQKQTIPCSQRTDCQYNYFPLSPTVTNMVFGAAPADLSSDEVAFLSGFFGRDRSDPSGVPNDNPIRTTVGAYPAAGLIDDAIESTAITNRGTGDGIFPMLSSWMMKFYLMEAMLALNVTVPDHTVETLLESALDDQITKVIAVGTASDPAGAANVAEGDTDWPIDYEESDDFIADVVADYTAAPQKLNFVLKQAWFANYGNGYEIYNAFRRTGLPNTLQAPLQHPRQFALRLPYTQDEINSNPNVPSVVYDQPSNKLFWDPIGYQF